MNSKYFALVLGTAAMIITAGCVVSTTNGTGGSGGNGNGGDGGAGGTTTVGVGGKGGGGGAGGAAPCVSCASYITDGLGELCEASGKIYDSYALCICGDPANPAVTNQCGASGAFDKSCADNACEGKAATPACEDCQKAANAVDANVPNSGGCEAEFKECSNDAF